MIVNSFDIVVLFFGIIDANNKKEREKELENGNGNEASIILHKQRKTQKTIGNKIFFS